MREFPEFPDKKICPICGTNDNKPCILIPIDGTELEDDWRTCEAAIVHVSCLHDGDFRFNREVGVIYKRLKNKC